MKLIELLKSRFPTWDDFPKNTFSDAILTSKVLELMLPDLQKCDEFKNTRLIIAHMPVMPDVDDNDTVVGMLNYLLHNDTEFRGKCYLYSINLTPEIFDPMRIHKPIKDGCVITPVMYSAKNFMPYKEIVMNQTVGMDDLEMRASLHKKLDMILDNPNEYQMKGDRGVMIRGNMNEIKSPEKPVKTLF
jgi:hypothetical protein